MDLDVCYTSLYIQLISKEIILDIWNFCFAVSNKAVLGKKFKNLKPVDYSGDFQVSFRMCVLIARSFYTDCDLYLFNMSHYAKPVVNSW